MAQDINVVAFSGRLGKDAEVKNFGDGKAVVNFRMAVNTRTQVGSEWTDKPMWMNVSYYREGIAEYLKKGKQVLVSGRLKSFEKDDDAGGKRTYFTVVADNIVLCGGGRDDGSDSGDDMPF